MTTQTMIDKDKIIKEIEEKQKSILSNLNSENMAVYIFLKNEYAKGKILDNFVFQFVFRTYYRLDNAGLSDGIKRRFFELLDQKQINLETILSELYEIPTLKGKKTIQFSFATKLLHTINSNKPIFALEISRVTNIRPTGSGEAKIHSCIERYDFLEKRLFILNIFLPTVCLLYTGLRSHLKSISFRIFLFPSKKRILTR